MALSSELERCVHSVRGPVVWSETITARANAFGDEDVFVCAHGPPDFDGPENRLLVWLLIEAARAAKAVAGRIGDLMAPGDCRRIEEIAITARTVAAVAEVAAGVARALRGPRDRPDAFGRHGEQVEPLLVARRRLLQPFASVDIEDLTDPRTAVLHVGVLEVFETVSAALRDRDGRRVRQRGPALRPGGLPSPGGGGIGAGGTHDRWRTGRMTWTMWSIGPDCVLRSLTGSCSS